MVFSVCLISRVCLGISVSSFKTTLKKFCVSELEVAWGHFENVQTSNISKNIMRILRRYEKAVASYGSACKARITVEVDADEQHFES